MSPRDWDEFVDAAVRLEEPDTDDLEQWAQYCEFKAWAAHYVAMDVDDPELRRSLGESFSTFVRLAGRARRGRW